MLRTKTHWTVIADAGLKVTAAEVVGWGSVLRTLGLA